MAFHTVHIRNKPYHVHKQVKNGQSCANAIKEGLDKKLATVQGLWLTDKG